MAMEREFLDWLKQQLSPSPNILGIGDDAAVLSWTGGNGVVVTTDAVTDDVDFRLGEISPEQAGHKALGVNLSDLAAMAAEPVAAFVTLVLPRDGALRLAKRIINGMIPLAERHGIQIAGGDTNVWDGRLVISVTAIGRTTARGPLTRSGARPGDELLVTGTLGGSILGRHLAVEPRVAESLRLHAAYDLRAGIDVSDGLALDASRLAAASDCGVALDLASVPISDAARRLSATTGRVPLDHALGDGEDFELLIAAPHSEAGRILRDQPLDVPVTRIGRFVETPGLWQTTDGGVTLAPLAPSGFQH
jgi:thiamine-monophosphate kinase